MSLNRNSYRPITNSRGMISAEFLFSLVLAAGLCIVLFSLTFTFSMVEVAQYIAFSSSRAHAAGHLTQDLQVEMGRRKYNELINNKILKSLFNNPEGGWFKLSGFEIKGAGPSGDTFSDYSDPLNRIPQVGVRFNFVAKLLDIKVPFIGSTSENSGNDPFSAKVTALLIREPTVVECQEQMRARYEAILALDPQRYSIGNSGISTYTRNPAEDNGC